MTLQTCGQIEQHLSAYLDEELDENLQAQVTEHLQRCPHCRETLASLGRVVGLVKALPRGTAPADLSEMVIARLERQELYGGAGKVPTVPTTPPGVLRFSRLLASAAVILLTVTAGYLTIDYVRQSRQEEVRLAQTGKFTAGPAESNAPSARAAADRVALSDDANRVVRGTSAEPTEKPSAAEAVSVASAAKAGEGLRAAAPALVGKAGAPTISPATGPSEPAAPRPSAPSALGYVARSAAPSPPASQPPSQAATIADERLAKVSESKKDKFVARAGGVHEAKALGATDAEREQPGMHGGQTIRLADRLAGNVTVDELDQHPLDREEVRLVLTAPDSAGQEHVERQLRSFFARNAIIDARSLGARAQVDRQSNFYLAQVPQVPRANSEQFLFRGTPRQVSSLVDELGRAGPPSVQVTLTTPTIQAEGWGRANMAAQAIRVPSGPRFAMAKAKGRGPSGDASDTAMAQARAVSESAPAPPSQRGVQLRPVPAGADQRAQWLGTQARSPDGNIAAQEQGLTAGVGPSTRASPTTAAAQAESPDRAGPPFEPGQAERRVESVEGQARSLGVAQPMKAASAETPGRLEEAGPVQRVAVAAQAKGAPRRVDARSAGLPAPQQQLQVAQVEQATQPAIQAAQTQISARQQVAQSEERRLGTTSTGSGYGGGGRGPSDDGGGAGGSGGTSRRYPEAAEQDHLVTVVITLQTMPRPDASGKPASRSSP